MCIRDRIWGYVRSLDRFFTELYNLIDNVPYIIYMTLIALMAVSYTHLDVYKRQQQGRTLHPVVKNKRTTLSVSADAVSYTHLKVFYTARLSDGLGASDDETP